MQTARERMTTLLESCGVGIDGFAPWDIRTRDERWLARVLRDQSLGLGEAYMEGWWECGQIDEMIARLLRGRITRRLDPSLRGFLKDLPSMLLNLQSRGRVRLIAKHHYDLGNDFFGSFLDPYWQYSCGYFARAHAADLDGAQRDKLALICEKLGLRAGDHLLDIGCGWGGLARYAAEQHGCRVTGVNISRPQLEFARESCKGLPVEFVESDYRSIEGQYDRIVSVGMFEHVGPRNYRAFMEAVRRCLREGGTFLLHTIGGNTSGPRCDPWIRRYIFPNSLLPSLTQIMQAAEGRFVIEDVHNLGPHYDLTLMAWHRRFQEARPRLSDRLDERFRRMWEYYLLSCAGAFRARHIQLWQVLMTTDGKGTPQPAGARAR